MDIKIYLQILLGNLDSLISNACLVNQVLDNKVYELVLS